MLPSHLVTWTASWVVWTSSTQRWHWWTLLLGSVQLSVSCGFCLSSVHLWIWWTFPSASLLSTVSLGHPLGAIHLWVDDCPLSSAVLDSVWTWSPELPSTPTFTLADSAAFATPAPDPVTTGWYPDLSSTATTLPAVAVTAYWPVMHASTQTGRSTRILL